MLGNCALVSFGDILIVLLVHLQTGSRSARPKRSGTSTPDSELEKKTGCKSPGASSSNSGSGSPSDKSKKKVKIQILSTAVPKWYLCVRLS